LQLYDEVNIRGLRKTHFEQLLTYLENRDREEWYYGNKNQFEKRHEELRVWIKKLLKKE